MAMVFKRCNSPHLRGFGAGAEPPGSHGRHARSDRYHPGERDLRAEVNPNGLPTTVEFAFLGEWDQVTQSWTVDAGSGTEPVVVEQRVSGLVPYSRPILQARATNSAGSVKGLKIPVVLNGPDDADLNTPDAVPIAALLPLKDVTERSATIQVEINPNGLPTTLKAVLVFVVNSENWETLNDIEHWEDIRHLETKEIPVGRGKEPIRMEFPVTGLYRGKIYQVNIFPYSKYIGGASTEAKTFTTLGEPGHNPPDVANATLRVPIGSTESYTRVP